jgi:hypothetical protein
MGIKEKAGRYSLRYAGKVCCGVGVKLNERGI